MSEQPARYQRSFSGLIGALLVLILVVGTFVVFRGLNRSDPADPVQEVDYLQSVRFARDAADFELLAPRQLPAGWIATSVRFQDADPDKQSWHLGLLTQDRRYVGLEQARRSAAEMVARHVDEDARRAGEVDIDGTAWQSWTDPGRSATDPNGEGDLALVNQRRDVTTLVVGTDSLEALTGFVQLLR